MPFELRITNAGRAALADGTNRGVSALQLTKLAIGDGSGPGGESDDTRTALRNQRAVVAAGGSTMVEGRIVVRGDFTPDADYGVTEVGLLGRVGTGPEILVAYWSDDGARLASTVRNSLLVIAGSLDITASEAEVTVTVNPSISLGDPALSAAVTALGGRMDTAESDIDTLERRAAVPGPQGPRGPQGPQGLPGAGAGYTIWSGSQAAYNAIPNKSNTTVYLITS